MSELPDKYRSLLGVVRQRYGEGDLPLHSPVFRGNEKRYLEACIDSTFVSSVGPFVGQFEAEMRRITGARYAVATTNGTSALHVALLLAGVEAGDEVIAQPLSFVATCNAISYIGAHPVFVDVDPDTLGMSPQAVSAFLDEFAELRDSGCFNRVTGRRIAAAVPMHTFGLPMRIVELVELCERWRIPVVEDAAESLGSTVGERHTGTFGAIGTFSFNGNKTVTSGGGGCIVTDDEAVATLGKHLTTTAKVPHRWEFVHDRVGYNYRMPNINAALACAQLEQLPGFLADKRETALLYADACARLGIAWLGEREGTRSNYWLNAIETGSLAERDALLEASNAVGIMTRPIWRLMPRLAPFSNAQCAPLPNAERLESVVVNLPSSVRP